MKTRVRINWKDWGMNEDFYTDYQGVESLRINKYGETSINIDLPEVPLYPLWWNDFSKNSQDGFIGEEIITERATVRKGRRCAICGKQIRKADLCNEHYKEYGPIENYSDWVKELISMESHIQRSIEPKEVVNSTRSNDEYDFLADSELTTMLIENKYEGVIPGAARKLKKHEAAL